ncbi:MAG: sugar phosphate isomerase/epimerase family protein [bacterium]
MKDTKHFQEKRPKSGSIRIGNQTSFAVLPITRPFKYAVARGFDAFEWFPDRRESGEGWTEDDLTSQMRILIRKTARDHDIRLSVHAPWQVNPFRRQAGEYLQKTLRLARDIGAQLVNVHFSHDEGVTAYGEAILSWLDLLAHDEIRLSLENTPESGPEDFNELFTYLHRFEHGNPERVGMCLDAGHANLWPATRGHYPQFIDLLEPHVPIIHIHMHENYGDADSHLALFTGPDGRDGGKPREFMKRMIERGFTGSIILEQWPQPPLLLDEARKRLLAMIDEMVVQDMI